MVMHADASAGPRGSASRFSRSRRAGSNAMFARGASCQSSEQFQAAECFHERPTAVVDRTGEAVDDLLGERSGFRQPSAGGVERGQVNPRQGTHLHAVAVPRVACPWIAAFKYASRSVPEDSCARYSTALPARFDFGYSFTTR